MFLFGGFFFIAFDGLKLVGPISFGFLGVAFLGGISFASIRFPPRSGLLGLLLMIIYLGLPCLDTQR